MNELCQMQNQFDALAAMNLMIMLSLVAITVILLKKRD